MSIMVGVLTGAAFGAVGGLVGSLLSKSISNPALRSRITVICVAVAAAASRPVAAEIIEPRLTQMQVEKQLAEMPTFAAMKQYYPTEYARAVAQLKASIKSGGTTAEAANTIRAQIGSAIQHALPLADEANTVAMMRLVRDEGAALRSRSEDECGRFVTSGSTSLDLRDVFGEALGSRDMELTAAMLRQAATAPHPWPSKAVPTHVEALASQALSRIPAPDRAKVTQSLASPSPTLAAQCVYTIALIDELLSEPPSVAAGDFQTLQAASS